MPRRKTPISPPAKRAGRRTNASASSAASAAAAPDLYEMTAKENPAWVFNPAYPPQPIWGFTGNTPDATTPGPTLFARYGQPDHLPHPQSAPL